jgi:outer membrane protein assembly factor BamB
MSKIQNKFPNNNRRFLMSHKNLRRQILLSLVSFALMIGLACLLSQPLFADDWNQWRGSERNGISNETGWSATWSADGPKQLWKVAVGIGYTSVSVSNGFLYTMGNTNKTDTVYCLDANKGTEIWKYSYPCAAEGAGYPGPASTPTIDGNSVYTLSREGHLFCFDAKTGQIKWSKNIPKDFEANLPDWGIACSPLVFGEKLIVSGGRTVAVNKNTGELIWKSQDYHGGYSSPMIFDFEKKPILAIFNTLGLVILNSENGQEITHQAWKTDYNVNASTPIIAGSNIFISSGYNVGGALFSFDGKSLTQIWKNKNMRNQFTNSVLFNDNLYGFDEEQLRCLDFKTGTVKWTQKGTGIGTLMIADGKLIAITAKGTLMIIEASPDAYKELASANVLSGLCWTVPVLSGGKIYCKNHEGDLVCLDVKK